MTNYIDKFKSTEVMKAMLSGQSIPESMRVNTEVLNESCLDREEIKSTADQIGKMGFQEGYIILKDISHWMRHLANNPDNPKDFFEYVEWKYTNLDQRT